MGMQIFSGPTKRAVTNVGITAGLTRLFAPTDRQIAAPLRDPGITAGLRSFNPQSFTSPGLSGDFGQGGLSLRRNPLFSSASAGLGDTFQQQADFIRSDLLPQVKPGAGGFTSARTEEIQDRRKQAIDRVRQNLERRRLGGSTFARDAVRRADLEFDQLEREARAQSFLDELGPNILLAESAFDLERRKFNAELNQLNLESGLAAEVAQNATKSEAALALGLGEMLTKLATSQSSIRRASAEGVGRFIGQEFSFQQLAAENPNVNKNLLRLLVDRGLSNAEINTLIRSRS